MRSRNELYLIQRKKSKKEKNNNKIDNNENKTKQK
jgi:hypothetical protein